MPVSVGTPSACKSWPGSMRGRRSSRVVRVRLGIQPVAPDTPVTTVRRNHLERLSMREASIVALVGRRPAVGARPLRLHEFRHSQYLSTDAVLAGGIQCGLVEKVVREWL